MEKIKKLFLLMAILIPAIAFTACGDDDESEANNNELVGTTWEYIYNNNEHGYYCYETISFKSDSQCDYTLIEQEQGATVSDITANGTYSYNPPKVTVSISYGSVSVTKNLTLSGDKLIVEDDGYALTRK